MAEQIFKKETEWGVNSDDFAGESELMVQITLHEYRELVEKNARTEQRIKEAEEKAYKAKKEADEARAKMEKVLSMTSSLSIVTEEEDEDEI